MRWFFDVFGTNIAVICLLLKGEMSFSFQARAAGRPIEPSKLLQVMWLWCFSHTHTLMPSLPMKHIRNDMFTGSILFLIWLQICIYHIYATHNIYNILSDQDVKNAWWIKIVNVSAILLLRILNLKCPSYIHFGFSSSSHSHVSETPTDAKPPKHNGQVPSRFSDRNHRCFFSVSMWSPNGNLGQEFLAQTPVSWGALIH